MRCSGDVDGDSDERGCGGGGDQARRLMDAAAQFEHGLVIETVLIDGTGRCQGGDKARVGEDGEETCHTRMRQSRDDWGGGADHGVVDRFSVRSVVVAFKVARALRSGTACCVGIRLWCMTRHRMLVRRGCAGCRSCDI